LIPDASTLRILFADGQEWAGEDLRSRIGTWVAEVAPAAAPSNH
jgi:hypothetical protein